MINNINFQKSNGLVPVIIQDDITAKVLRKELWTKGETSGNFLSMKSITLDCDEDTLLIKVIPTGPVCHTGSDTCFNEKNEGDNFLLKLQKIIQSRKDADADKSYTASLFQKGINKIAQKVGEEAVELVIESKDDNADLFLNEAADLMYHYLVLLAAKDFKLEDVISILEDRHQ